MGSTVNETFSVYDKYSKGVAPRVLSNNVLRPIGLLDREISSKPY